MSLRIVTAAAVLATGALTSCEEPPAADPPAAVTPPEPPHSTTPTPVTSKPPLAVRRLTPTPTSHPSYVVIPRVWLALADCESGEWDRHKQPIWNSRHWDYNDGTYQGGFNFNPHTWTDFAPDGYPATADKATPLQQLVVARRVLHAQGVHAWPICGPKVGLWRAA